AFAEPGLTAGMHCSLRRQLVDIGPLWVDDDPSNGVTWGGRIADENGRHLLMGRAPATPWVPGLALDLRWVPSGLVALLLELSYSHDPLRCGTRHHGSGPGFNILSYSMICLPPSEPHRLGLALAAQARF
ncbi:MAG TPA: hypothetical protein P5076_23395, partial [Myxococcota bacterium]|nr:hypothetical protein [Myxococcota bacterium]